MVDIKGPRFYRQRLLQRLAFARLNGEPESVLADLVNQINSIEVPEIGGGESILKPVPLPEPPCIHRGAPRDDTVKVSCTGCGGKKPVEHRAYACAVHKRCLPFFNGPWDADHELESKLYHLCEGCDEKELPPAGHGVTAVADNQFR
jgi:hypothetical protein